MNITDHIPTVTRRIKPADSGHAVELQRIFDHPRTTVWDSMTSSAHLAQWFGDLDGDLSEGGRYHQASSGTTGTIEVCQPPHQLRVTWEFAGDISVVVVSISPNDDSATTVTLRHDVPDDDHWATYGPAATGVGWDGAFLSLALYLDGDPRAHPEQMQAVSQSPVGQDFVVKTAAAWADAHIAGGADPDHARAVASATSDFYRGIEPS